MSFAPCPPQTRNPKPGSMESPPTLSTAPFEHPALDFDLLRKEGLAHIRRLAGYLWTDHNVHDPGITILEQLCYALTDLGYRIEYDIEDLLATGEDDPYHSLYSPADVLTTHPVTLTDLRKIVIDVEGVKNAWIEPVERPEPPVFYDPADQTLYLEDADHREAVAIRGIYQVLVEADGSVLDLDLADAVSERLLACRSLCEDFEPPVILPAQKIILDADVEIDAVEDPEQMLAELYHALANFISPRICFYTLAEMLARGKRIDEVFDGPVLLHGFIDTDDLEGFERKTALRTSDLIQVLMDVKGVFAVHRIRLWAGPEDKAQNEGRTWYLEMAADRTPVLDIDASHIRLVRGQVVVDPDPQQKGRVKTLFDALQQAARYPLLPESQRDIRLGAGRDRHVERYQSIQHHFPETYGVGALGLPASASERRKGQTRQLKAYLMFFDQLLANYFSQLAHAKDLFSFQYHENQTYFAQVLSTVPGAQTIFKGGDLAAHTARLKTLTEDEDTALGRRQRFLNHLLARFCEQFTDYSLLMYAQLSPEKLISDKCAFLEDYREIGAGRGRAFDYTMPSWGTDNVSGLVKRISRLLGIEDYTRRHLLAVDLYDDFVADFRAWLQAHFTFAEDDFDALLIYGLDAAYYAYDAGRIVVRAPKPEGTPEGAPEPILATSSQTYTPAEKDTAMAAMEQHLGLWQASLDQAEGFHMIEHLLLRPRQADKDQWTQDEGVPWQAPVFLAHPVRPDPYSAQLSFVFPAWITRFKDESFQAFVWKTLREETPAHLGIHLHWLHLPEMRAFEAAYRDWLDSLTT